VVEDCGVADSPRGEESLAAEAAQGAVGRRAATGSDWSNVRRFMDEIVAEVWVMGRGGRNLAEFLFE
jgi:hypothetical protein